MTGLKMAEEAQERRLADRIRAFGVGNVIAVVIMVLIGAGLLWPGMIVNFAESAGSPTAVPSVRKGPANLHRSWRTGC